jgi:hypothetical protein
MKTLFIDTIKEGIHTVHKNWQLVLVQFVSMFLSFASFFIIVGIPIAVAFIMFGLDLTEILRLKDLASAFRGSAGLLQKYFGMAVVILLSLIVYLGFISVLLVFTIAGTTGIFSRTIKNELQAFTLREFWAEGKRLFSPVLIYTSVIGAIFIVLTFVLGIFVGGASTIIDIAKAQEATLGLFLGVFFFLLLLSLGLFLILITVAVAFYGSAYLVFNKVKAWKTLRGTLQYLYAVPSAVGLNAVLLFGYLFAGFMVLLAGTLIALIPYIGPVLLLPYQIATYFIQGYVSLLMLATLFCYYYKTGYVAIPLEMEPVTVESPVIAAEAEPDISQQTADGQACPPGETDQHPQV